MSQMLKSSGALAAATLASRLLGMVREIVYAGFMGATWQALVLGVLGVRFTDQGPVADPAAAARLPERWRAVSLALTWRGQPWPVAVSREAAS